MKTGVVDQRLTSKQYGLLLGFVGVVCFSFTMPMTKLALASFNPWLLTFGRVSGAGLVSLALMARQGKLHLIKRHFLILVGISLGVALGFPLLTSLALHSTSSSHAGIVLALLPLITAILGAFINRESHRPVFWVVSASGCLTVLGYVMLRDQVTLQPADLLLLGAALSAGFGYTLGAKLTRNISGLDVICCALIMMLPVSIPATAISWSYQPPVIIHESAIIAMIYVTLFSQLFGFVPWYKGLALGGVALVSQVQLLQTFLTLIFSSWLLGESIGILEYGIAILVIAQIYSARKVG